MCILQQSTYTCHHASPHHDVHLSTQAREWSLRGDRDQTEMRAALLEVPETLAAVCADEAEKFAS